jgi:DNA transposition AAA+ family ATPase
LDQSLHNLETIAVLAQADADHLLARLDREEHEYCMALAKLNEKNLGEDDQHASMRENIDAAWENDDARLLLHSSSEIVSGLTTGGDLLGKSV